MTKENLVKCEDGSKTQTRRVNERYKGIKKGDTLFFRSNYKTTYQTASGPYEATNDAKSEALQAITDADSMAEGITKGEYGFYNVYGKDHPKHVFFSPRYAFGNLINQVNGGPRWNMPGKPKPIWDVNPQVVKIEFRRIE
jgi:hypothetical protein